MRYSFGRFNLEPQSNGLRYNSFSPATSFPCKSRGSPCQICCGPKVKAVKKRPVYMFPFPFVERRQEGNKLRPRESKYEFVGWIKYSKSMTIDISD